MKAKKFVRQIRDLFLQYPITFPNVEDWSNDELFLATELALKSHVKEKQAPALAATFEVEPNGGGIHHTLALKKFVVPKGYKLSEVQKRNPEEMSHLATLTRRGHAIGDILLTEPNEVGGGYTWLHFMSDYSSEAEILQDAIDDMIRYHEAYIAKKKKGGK
jgi:hypothetical protein